MAYSQYKSLKLVRENLGIAIDYANLFPSIAPVEPSDWLLQTLAFSTEERIAYFSEKSRSEALVYPVLLETLRRNKYQCSLYSGAILEADSEKGLNGECDFILSRGKQSIELEKPLFCIVEAKDNDIELGIPQCIAQMVGAQYFNEQNQSNTERIFGAVTTGDTWVFLKLEQGTASIDNKQYYLNQPGILLGIFDAIVGAFVG